MTSSTDPRERVIQLTTAKDAYVTARGIVELYDGVGAKQ